MHLMNTGEIPQENIGGGTLPWKQRGLVTCVLGANLTSYLTVGSIAITAISLLASLAIFFSLPGIQTEKNLNAAK